MDSDKFRPVDSDRISSGERSDGFQSFYWIKYPNMDYEAEYARWWDMLKWAKEIDNQWAKEDQRQIRIILAQIAELM